jgi:hypothetical protein
LRSSTCQFVHREKAQAGTSFLRHLRVPQFVYPTGEQEGFLKAESQAVNFEIVSYPAVEIDVIIQYFMNREFQTLVAYRPVGKAGGLNPKIPQECFGDSLRNGNRCAREKCSKPMILLCTTGDRGRTADAFQPRGSLFRGRRISIRIDRTRLSCPKECTS